MSDDSPSGGEIDALRVYVWGMAAVSVVAAGLVWWLRGRHDELRATVASARASLAEISQGKREIVRMLDEFRKNKEDEARSQPLTWFQTVWKGAGIPDNCVQLEQWKVPADTGPDGSYKEEKIGVKFSSKNPLRRDLVGQFLHRVEHSSSRLRILTLQLRRAGRDETLANDEWTGQCEIGYRYPNMRE